MAETIGEALFEVMPDLGDFEELLVEGVEEAADQAVAAATDSLGEITEQAEDTAEGSADEFSDAAEGIVESMEDASEDAVDSLEDLSEAGVESFEDLAEGAESSLEEVADETEGTADDLVGSWEDAGEDVIDAFDEATSSISDSFDEMADEATLSTESVAEAAGETADEVEDSLSEAFTEVSESAESAGADVADALDGISAEADEAGDAVATAFSESMDDLAATAEGAVGEASSMFDDLATSAEESAGGVEAAFDGAGGDIGGTFDSAAGAAGDAGDDMEESMSASAGAIGGIFAGLAKQITLPFLAGSAAAGGMLGVVEGVTRSQQSFNSNLEQTAEITGVSVDELREVVDQVTDHTFASEDAAEAMLDLQKAEVDTREGLEDTLPILDRYADATGEEITGSLREMDRLMRGLGRPFSDVGEVIDDVARLTFTTDIRLQQMGRQVSRVGSELEILDFGMRDVAAGVQVFQDRNLDGQEALREFRREVEDSEGDMDVFLENLGLTNEEWENYIEEVEPAADLTERLADAANSNLTPMERMWQVLQNVWAELSKVAELMLEPIIPWLDRFETRIDEWSTTAREAIEDADDLSGAIIALLESFGLVEEGFDPGEAATRQMEEASKGAENLGDAVIEALSTSFDRIGEWLGDALEGVVEGLEGSGGLVSAAADLLLDVIETALEFVRDNASLISSLISAIVSLIEGVAEEGGDEILDRIVNDLGPLFVEAGVELTVALVEGLADAAPRLVSVVFDDLIPALVGALLDTGTGRTENAGERVGDAFLEGLLSILGSIGEAVWEIAVELEKAFIVAVLPVVLKVVEWFRELPDKAKAAIAAGTTALKVAGRAIVTGIWDGISSLGSWLWNKMTGFIGDKVVDAVDTVLDISSPSAEMVERGRSLVEGLAEGVVDQEDEAVREIERFANRVSSVDLMLGDPSIGAVEGDIDRAAARRRNVSGDDGRPTQHTVDRSIKEMTVFATDWKNAQRQIEQRQRIERLKGGPRE